MGGYISKENRATRETTYDPISIDRALTMAEVRPMSEAILDLGLNATRLKAVPPESEFRGNRQDSLMFSLNIGQETSAAHPRERAKATTTQSASREPIACFTQESQYFLALSAPDNAQDRLNIPLRNHHPAEGQIEFATRSWIAGMDMKMYSSEHRRKRNQARTDG